MIYKLHPAMIELYKGDPKRIQHFSEDFFVEESFSKEVAKSAYDSIFNTECGRSICREMFGRS